jgi:hypothetical protein
MQEVMDMFCIIANLAGVAIGGSISFLVGYFVSRWYGLDVGNSRNMGGLLPIDPDFQRAIGFASGGLLAMILYFGTDSEE